MSARRLDRAARARWPGCTGSTCPSSTSAAATASPTPREHTPLHPGELGEQMADLVERELKAVGDGGPDTPTPRISIEPGRAIVGPSTFTLYEVGTVKDVDLGGGALAHLRLGRRRHERQHPHRALRRRLLLHPGQPPLRRGAAAGPRGRASTARAATSSSWTSTCRTTSRPATSIAVPGTGAYCRSMASQYNHTPRPPVVAVRDGRAGCWCAARRWTTCWPSTSADAIAPAPSKVRMAEQWRPRSGHPSRWAGP